MKMYSTHNPRRSLGKRLVSLFLPIALAGGAVATIGYFMGVFPPNAADEPTDQPGQVPASAPADEPTGPAIRQDPASMPAAQASKPAPGPAGMTQGLAAQIGPSPLTVSPASPQAARAAYAEGMKLYDTQQSLLAARAKLNTAYTSGHLTAEQAASARKALESLAAMTVLKPDTYVHPDDPYMTSYTFEPGDRLNSVRRDGKIVREGVIARLDLNTPASIILRVNGLASATDFKAGRSYKMLKGPFHLVVYRDANVADVYLQDLFVKRIGVCVGARETPTPTGYFRLAANGKTMHSAYNAPAAAGIGNATLFPGDEGYPLNALGQNMKIEGIRPLGTDISVAQSYALHGTNDPSSIGTAASRGCVRLSDEDVQFLYDALMGYGDPSDPNVTWNRWSTVTILP